MREVEPELVGTHGRPRLADMVAENVLQRLVEQVRRGVVRHCGKADAPRDDCLHAVAGGKAAAAQKQRLVVAEAVRLDELGPRPGAVVELDEARIGDLSAARRVEGRLAELREEEPVADVLERAELGQHLRLRVADELGLESRRARELRRPLQACLAAAAGNLAMLLHLVPVAVDVDCLAPLLGQLDRQLEREAVGGGERECILAADRLAAGELLEHLQAALEGLA